MRSVVEKEILYSHTFCIIAHSISQKETTKVSIYWQINTESLAYMRSYVIFTIIYK